MTNKEYCMVNEVTNICDNVCLWDGNTDTWQPPTGYLMLVKEDIPSKTWDFDETIQDYVLTDTIGQGGVGFTWDGTYLTTNVPKPEIVSQPTEPTKEELMAKLLEIQAQLENK